LFNFLIKSFKENLPLVKGLVAKIKAISLAKLLTLFGGFLEVVIINFTH
jgi:hypothetical protein